MTTGAAVSGTKTSAPTQRDRVLGRLRAAGEAGVSPEDFLLPGVVDGGKPILRLAARIHELVEDGLKIETRRCPNGVTRYALADPPPVPAPVAAIPADGTAQASIFDLLNAAA
jgi:hypothetical protein